MQPTKAQQEAAAARWLDVRTLLTIPAHRSDFLAKALLRGADALVIDLEDGVDPSEKDRARETVRATIDQLAGRGTLIAVRINAEPGLVERDVEASMHRLLDACVIPKVVQPDDVHRVAQLFGDQCPALAITIEHPRALAHLHTISHSDPRIAALVFGGEDFAAAMGVTANGRSLAMPAQLVALAAHAAGVAAIGLAGPVGLLDDQDSYRELVARAFDLGFTGIPCVHPAQVAAVHQELEPCGEEIEYASAVLDAFHSRSALGGGAFRFRGRMVDPPVVAQAQRVLARARK